MQKESHRLNKQISLIQSQINSLPNGNFFCCKNGKYFKWYHTDGKHQTIIPKKNRAFAQKLALKRVLLLQLEELQKEKEAVDAYLQKKKSIVYKSQLLLEENDAYRQLISENLKSKADYLNEWKNAPYERNKNYPEQLNNKAFSGNYVRSKSEAMIDMFLTQYKIPFRYECALQLGHTTFYPDFTIRHPDTDEIYYWEHFGKMDDQNYAKATASKIQLYVSESIHMFQEEIDSFVRCVKTGDRNAAHIDQAIITARMMQAIYDSSEQKREITLDW